MRNRSLPRALLALILVAGCKSSSETADAGPSDAAYEAGPCGDAAACATGQLCVSHQNCTNLACTPVPDGGQCPAGTAETPSCPDGGPPGCIAGCAGTFRCQPRPSGCATVNCSCAVALCAPDTCIATMGDRVACATQ